MSQATVSQLLQTAIKLHQEGKLLDAEELYQQILKREPKQIDALHLVGVIALQQGRLDFAIEQISRAVEINPNQPVFHNNLGIALGDAKRTDEARTHFTRAIALKPDYAEAHANLAGILAELGEVEAAVTSAREAVRLNPNLPEGHVNLAKALNLGGRSDEAIAAARKAIELRPNLYAAHNNLGVGLFNSGRLLEAAEAYRQALAHKPDSAETLGNLGTALKDLGEIGQAIECQRRAMTLSGAPNLHSNLVFTMHFDMHIDPNELAAEHANWARIHAEPHESVAHQHENEPDPDRRLRIGYVSPDFRSHSVGRFIVPLLANHHRDRFEIFCYASVSAPDRMTDRIKSHADKWRDIRALSDGPAAKLIVEDRIDVLVDLAMHGANNRLPIFARKPAPIQVTYLAYPGTTGLKAMDYRITDPFLDPPGARQDHYSEKSVYLPHNYWCYEPPPWGGAVSALPAESAGFVTFGCFNNFSKVSPAALAAWVEILGAVPSSRLMLHTAEGPHRDRIVHNFAARGVESSRLTFVPFVSMNRYFQQYGSIDIALDPFPNAGGTTTCDSLWMGVPVVTLRGETAMGRGGVSILSNTGLTDWIADDVSHYVLLAIKMAGNLSALAELRAGLRQRMQASPLMNAAQFATDMESLYRKVWIAWCAKQVAEK